jgi:NAD(P)-dependent dehydrogenase (short-subunit alcohol dehydrogenase family)
MTQTIFITGASSGIGRATAQYFHAKGWNVVATLRDPAQAGDLAALSQVLVSRLDVTDAATIAAAVDAAHERFGGIDVLLNNAGYGAYGPLEAFDMDGVRRQFDTNVIGLLEVTKAVLPGMRARGKGVIVNISSIAGLVAAPGMGAYNATKAAVWMYTKTLALEAAKADWNVRCNSVHPVFIKTPILDPFIAMAGGDEAKAHERLTRGIPLKRIGDPDDVAYCVLYLASDESRFVTGSEFKIDGGMTAQ